jgi:lipopolysaccharide export system protein LptA
MRFFYLLICLLYSTVSLYAKEKVLNQVTLSSDQLEHDGKRTVLKGHVALENEMGIITCDLASVFQETQNGGPEQAKIRLQQNVDIDLGKEGHLHCSRADIDTKDLTGVFLGGTQEDFVVFTEQPYLEDKKPIVLKSRRLFLHMNPTENEEIKKSYRIQELIAEYNVSVDYRNTFSAFSDQMTFRHHNDIGKENENALQGLVSLQAKGVGGTCQVITKNGDVIKAQQIYMDTQQQRVLFDHPIGTISIQDHNEYRNIDSFDFSAGVLTWDQESQVLSLADQVMVYHKEIGCMTSSGQVQVCLKQGKGVQKIEWMTSSGQTELTYVDAKGETHFLQCHDKVFVDAVQYKIKLNSPNHEGATPTEKQVFFHNDFAEVYADDVEIEYVMLDEKPSLAKLQLLGHVKILNHNLSQENKEEQGILQYALADAVDYNPDSQEMRLYAVEDGRVLFYDCSKKVQVSAPAVQVKTNPLTKKVFYEGEGDVRFTFIENELDTFAKSFPFITEYKDTKTASQEERSEFKNE